MIVLALLGFCAMFVLVGAKQRCPGGESEVILSVGILTTNPYRFSLSRMLKGRTRTHTFPKRI